VETIVNETTVIKDNPPIETHIGNITVNIKTLDQSYYDHIQFISYSNVSPTIPTGEAKLIYDVAHEAALKYHINFEAFLVLGAVESDFIKNAVSKSGAKYGRGIWQVSEIALADYNRIHKTSYRAQDLFDIKINAEIAAWVFVHNINYGVTNKYSDLYIAYNIGCGEWKLQAETIKAGLGSGRNWKRLNSYLSRLNITDILEKRLVVK
jgi:soluble lytic murein transglycosylase-like protein